MKHDGDLTSSSAPRSAPGDEAETTPSRYGEGDVIANKYQLGRRLGQGGMGEVWLAHNRTLDIDVAIKLIRTEDAISEEMTDRLLNEARAAARLGHPAIVRINDFGKSERGDPYIVMELLNGEDLADTLEQYGRLSATKAVRMLLPIAHALTAAHTKGIVHRDLKPENIFMARTDDGQLQPKLVDFGVAKLEARYPGHVTQSGALLGSPLYMSPEQARGDDVDHRADIWALGVVLYELVTGRPPFEGKNYNAILYSIIANPATPTTDLGVGDHELWVILERALQKDPDRRWYSMRDFGEALATWLEDRGIVDDVSGASLQTAWLQWQREGDKLATLPPAEGRESTSAPPTAANIPPPPSLPTRSRQITVKRARDNAPRRFYLVLAGSALLVLALAVAAMLTNRETVVEGGPLPESAPRPSDVERSTPASAATPAVASPIEERLAAHADEAASRDGAHESIDLRQDDVEAQPAVAPSSLPQAEDSDTEDVPGTASPVPSTRARTPRTASKKHAPKKPPSPTAGAPQKRLKNPFE